MTFEEWFRKNVDDLPSWYSNPYDEEALKIAYEAGYKSGLTKGDYFEGVEEESGDE